MKLQRLLSLVRKACDDYCLIDEHDKIAIGISGGKDSLTLLYALHGLKRFYPNPFEIEAITVDLGFEGFHTDKIAELCASLDVPYTVVKTDIGQIIFDERKEKNPCSLCAKMRKGSLNEVAKAHGCNKIAYGHHRDDLVETMMMSLMFEGRFYCYSPVTYLDRMELTVIRPLLFVYESDVIGFKNKYDLPISKNPCPADGNTKREYMKNLLKQLNIEHPGVMDKMFHAIINGNIPSWPKIDTPEFK